MCCGKFALPIDSKFEVNGGPELLTNLSDSTKY